MRVKVGLPALKVIVFVLCLVPLAKTLAAAFAVAGLSLGANPVETILHTMGKWGLNFLLITLAVTPLRRITGWNPLIRFRRMLGLFALAYITLHFTTYAWLDQGLDPQAIVEDIVERPYITLGMAAFVMLIALGVTSTRGMVRRLGRRWQMLHRLVYPIAILGVWHFWWQVKQDILEPAIYAAVLGSLLAFRLAWRVRQRRLTTRRAVSNTA